MGMASVRQQGKCPKAGVRKKSQGRQVQRRARAVSSIGRAGIALTIKLPLAAANSLVRSGRHIGSPDIDGYQRAELDPTRAFYWAAVKTCWLSVGLFLPKPRAAFLFALPDTTPPSGYTFKLRKLQFVEFGTMSFSLSPRPSDRSFVNVDNLLRKLPWLP
jgi:hypothetical protein